MAFDRPPVRSNPVHGLSSVEAATRLSVDGPNVLPANEAHLLRVLLDAIREPMFLLLLAAAAVYLVLGDLHEALLLLFMVSMTIGLTLYQEGKTEKALAALRDLSSPRALVLRDGQAIRISGREVVAGDVLVISEGDRIAADAMLVSATNLELDESLLTGESMPVRKRCARDKDMQHGRPGGDDQPYVWSGTLVVQGQGLARVTGTGPRSEIGKIGAALQHLTPERSPLQRETARLIRALALGGIGLSVVFAVAYGAQRGDWLQGALVGIALAMSLLPEEYPVILAVFPAIGAWRLSQRQVLTRRLPAIEILGSISVLCTDKTGTLTENRMQVVQMQVDDDCLAVGGDEIGLSAPFRKLAQYAALASKRQPFDPMEKAFHALAKRLGDDPSTRRPLREYGLSPQLRAMSVVWPGALAPSCTVATKGAPEDVARLCRLDAAQTARMLQTVDAMADQGLRVLAVAEASADAAALPDEQERFAFHYLGLIALADPLRKDVPESMRQCREAGIQVLMITGDHPSTAKNIASRAGMTAGTVLTGDELDRLDDAALGARLRGTSVCARIAPAQKLRIVQALKTNGEIVAMTGDGVNDAPALKAAHVGIAMGGRGTDVAREAAALVLLDDDFASIVRGIRHGRRIFANMRNAMAYVLSMHIPIAGLAFLPVVFGWPILLYPMQIAFLELIIDPACSVVFENEAGETGAMQRPPRAPAAPLLSRAMLMKTVLQGALALAVVAQFYVWALARVPENAARAGAFVVLVVANLMLIFSNLFGERNVLHSLRAPNRVAVLVALLTATGLGVTVYLPAVAGAFHFTALGPFEFAAALGAGIVTLGGYEAIKWGVRNSSLNKPSPIHSTRKESQ